MGDADVLADVVALIVDCEHKTAPAAQVGTAYGFSVGTPNIRNGRIQLEEAKRVDRSTYDLWTQRAVPATGDLILAREAPVGDTGYVDGRCHLCLGQRTVLIRPDTKRVHARFLHYRLLSPPVRGWMEERSAGSTVAHLNVADIRQIPVGPLPPLAEQRAIAEVLGALDDKIEANRRVAEGAERLAIAIPMSTMGTSPVESIAVICRKLVSTTFFAGQYVEHFSLPGFDANRLPIVENGDAIKSGKFLLEGSTVLVSKLNPHIPRVWMAVPSGTCLAITSTEFIGLVPKGDYPVEVLWALCASPSFSSQLVELVKGTTGSHQRVSSDDVVALVVPDPRVFPQTTTETIVSTVRLAGALRAESVHLSSLRDALLPRLLSGELRVRDAEEFVGESA